MAQEFQSFLHIIHFSDMHVRHPTSMVDIATERLVQRFAHVVRAYSEEMAAFLERHWYEGAAGHDPAAPALFRDFLRNFAGDEELSSIPVWLVNTGDISAQGDSASIDDGNRWIAEFAQAVGATQTISLYGNHDAWPGGFPLTSPLKISEHRRRLRSHRFGERFPQKPVTMPIPHIGGELQLFSLNSVLHDSWPNTFALGNVGNDPHWETPEQQLDQLHHLGRIAEESDQPDDAPRNFRLLALHHPVYYPPPAPNRTMRLLNAKQVANALVRFGATRARGLLAQMILSGHTHVAYPKTGDLEAQANRTCNPLTEGQLQCIAGSLCQRVKEQDRVLCALDDFVPHQCEILTFGSRDQSPEVLRVERRFVGRPAGAGRYKFIEFGNPRRFVESALIPF